MEMKKVKFGSLKPGDKFWFQGTHFFKFDESTARIVGIGKMVEFGKNTTVEIE
jgi:hypothetical protein